LCDGGGGGRAAIIVAVRFELSRDPDQFAACAGDFLAARVERNILATVLIDAVAGRYARLLFAQGLDGAGAVCFAALRTPPWRLLTSDLDPARAGELVERWSAEDPDLPGVAGPPATARAIAGAWVSASGGASRCQLREAIQVVSEVQDPPRHAPGRLRRAAAAERPLLVAWTEAFAHEAHLNVAHADAMVDGRLERGNLLVWEVGGAPVSMVGAAPSVAGVVRIGPVYTPPANRRRGYAACAVAATSRRALAQGASSCMLFTDLANSTSNKIYAEVGYVPVADWEEHVFEID
jgi:predicted GNAT family acetyltransferase